MTLKSRLIINFNPVIPVLDLWIVFFLEGRCKNKHKLSSWVETWVESFNIDSHDHIVCMGKVTWVTVLRSALEVLSQETIAEAESAMQICLRGLCYTLWHTTNSKRWTPGDEQHINLVTLGCITSRNFIRHFFRFCLFVSDRLVQLWFNSYDIALDKINQTDSGLITISYRYTHDLAAQNWDMWKSN